MKILFDTSTLSLISDFTTHDLKFYELPVAVDRCDILKEEYSETDDKTYYALGRFNFSHEFISVYDFERTSEGACLEIKQDV